MKTKRRRFQILPIPELLRDAWVPPTEEELPQVKLPYDPRRHPFITTHISAKTGGWAEVKDGPIIYYDVRDDIAAGLRTADGKWIGGNDAE